MKNKTYFNLGILRIISIILQLLFLKLYSKSIPVNELGLYYFLITCSYSLNAFLLVPIDYYQQSKIYHLIENKISLKSFYKLNIFIIKCFMILFSSIFIFLLIYNIKYIPLLFILIFFSISTYLVNLVRGIINNLEFRKIAVWSLILESALKITLLYLLIHLFRPSSFIILFSQFFASIAILVYLLLFFIKLDVVKFGEIKFFNIKEILIFSYPLTIGSIINYIQIQGYRLLLVPLGYLDLVGNYATVSNIGSSGMNAYSSIFSQLFIPNIYKSKGKYLSIYLRNAFISVLLIIVISYFFSNIIVELFTSNVFVKYSKLILFGIIAEAGNFIIGALSIYVTIHNFTKATIKASFFSLLIFSTTFLYLFLSNNINIYTIGFPIVLPQIFTSLYLYFLTLNHKNE